MKLHKKTPFKFREHKHTSSLFTNILICFILMMPLNNLFEVFAMMRGQLTSWTEVLTPTFVKAFKDLFLITCILLTFRKILSAPKEARLIFSKPFLLLNIFTLILISTSLYSFTFMPATTVMMGIRGYWVILLIYVGAYFGDFSYNKIYKVLTVVFILHIILQICQFITDVGYDVYYEHRSPGIFIVPATAGAFSLLFYYFANKYNNNLLKVLAILSLLLSASSIGLIAFIFYYFYLYKNRFKPKALYYPLFTAIVLATSYMLIKHFGEITGRGQGATFSFLARYNIIHLALLDIKSLFFGKGMGMATSQALLSGYEDAFIADNTYIGILYNIGLIPAILMLWFALKSFHYFESKLLFFMFFGYSMTTVIFELNPVIQLTLILLGAHIGQTGFNPVSKKNRQGGFAVTCDVGN